MAAGFFGPHTTDCALSSRARHLYFVLDPVEVRALWFSLGTILQILDRARAAKAHAVIRCIREAIERHVPAFTSELSVEMGFHESTVRSQVANPAFDPVDDWLRCDSARRRNAAGCSRKCSIRDRQWHDAQTANSSRL